MSGEERITQSRWGSKTRFEFGEDKLEFGLRDFSGEATSSLFYNEIDLEHRSTVKVNVARRYYPVIVVVGVLAALILQMSAPWLRDLAFVPLVLAILTYLVLRNAMTVTYTVLRRATGAGTPIRIIHDRKHDKILQRIKSEWAKRVRKLHLAVNSANDPKLEAQKFKWLLDHEVISDAEYQAAMEQLRPPVPASPVDKEQVVH